ncbi:subtilisin-like protein [Marasmius fiardii PR-910]|nr:subtilisin-like protein [Marasmius fiardii PR-910]
MKGYKIQKPKENSITITGYGEQFANKKDLQLFYKHQRLDTVGSSFEFVLVYGRKNVQDASEAGLEANLDVQFAFGLVYPTRSFFYSTGPENANEPYGQTSFYLNPIPPLVVSTSYSDDEQTGTCLVMSGINTFMQLGARGVSLTFASGDGRVGDGSSDPMKHRCITDDGRSKTKFIPVFPAKHLALVQRLELCHFLMPYSVTSVGGTTNILESGASFSGGGFSNYFKRPAYQSKVVDEYLEHLPKGLYSGLFDPSGRDCVGKAIPDVAAQSLKFSIYVSGEPVTAGGTSASAPTFAAVLVLLNDARLGRGLPSLGFLNPLLYSKGFNALNDIIDGNNPRCGTPGFNATRGWDPVSGLGTPDFQKLKDVVLRNY